MGTINISSIDKYKSSDTTRASGTGYDSDPVRATAESRARTNAEANTGYPSFPTPQNGNSTSSSYREFGFELGEVSTDTRITSAKTVDTSTGVEWSVTASCARTRTGTAYQVKLNFPLPNLTSSNIATATLSFNYTRSGDSSAQMAVCAPKTNSAPNSYNQPASSSYFQPINSFYLDSSGVASIDITNSFKQCLDYNQGWLVLTRNAKNITASSYGIITSTPTITYTLTNTPCGAPTNVSFSSIVKPGASLSISWTGSGGTNNSIVGYDLYYRIGSAPTTSQYDGYLDVVTTSTSGSGNFTIPVDAIRGSTFYAMIRTKGSAGSDYYSDWTADSGGKVNSLPGAPTVLVDKSRIKSTGSTTITFTVTPGSDDDTAQTKMVKYATSSSGTPQEMPANNQFTISAATTYYFWTYDGLEYSNSYTSKSIIVNTPPSITSITMEPYNNISYSPAQSSKLFVKNINCSETHTADAAAILTYDWKLSTCSTVSGTYVDQSSFGSQTSYTNLDVTTNGVSSFGKFYKVKLRITDDLGEYTEQSSSTIFCIPAAPVISNVYNQKANSNAANTNSVHFEDGIRIVYDIANTGVTREFHYSTSSNFSSYTVINIDGTSYSDVTLSQLTRGTNYYFRIKFICNNLNTVVNISNSAMMRAYDITPYDISVMPQSGQAIVKPYTDTIISFEFNNSPITSWAASQDVSTNYADIYSIKLKYGNNYINRTMASASISSGIVTATIAISDIDSSGWKTLMGTSNAPNGSYTIIIEIIAMNGFGATFSAIQTFDISFVEGFINTGSLVLSIKTGTNTYTNINTTTFTSSNRYSLFETQTIRFTLSGVKSYADQTAIIRLRQGGLNGTVLSTLNVLATDWTLTSGTKTWTLGNKIIDYIIPAITASSNSNFYVEIILANGESSYKTSEICKYRRIQTIAINPSITNVTENTLNKFVFTGTISDYGGDGGNVNSSGYSSILLRYIKCATPSGTYANVGTSDISMTETTSSNLPSSEINDTLSPLTNDILYFGIKLTLTLDFVSPDGSAMPTGVQTLSTLTFFNLYTLYRATPNLLYGKNYFVLNANTPINGVTNQILELHGTQTRNTIYIGDLTKATLTITNNGLTIDNFIINGGTWDS